jgi:hypothetical protein
MEASSLPSDASLPIRERLRDTRAARVAARHPQWSGVVAIGAFVSVLIVTDGVHDVAQTGLNGLSL